MKFNGSSAAKKPSTDGMKLEHPEIILCSTKKPSKQPDFEIFAAQVSGWAEFAEYIHESETPYITPPKRENKIPTTFDCMAGNQYQVVDHSAQPATIDVVLCFLAAFFVGIPAQ